jgi:hypothetical protein
MVQSNKQIQIDESQPPDEHILLFHKLHPPHYAREIHSIFLVLLDFLVAMLLIEFDLLPSFLITIHQNPFQKKDFLLIFVLLVGNLEN